MSQFTQIRTVVFTGPRPQNLCGNWNMADPVIKRVQERTTRVCERLIVQNGAQIFIQGMAAGFDLIAGLAIMHLKQQYPKVQLWAALPYPGCGERLNGAWQQAFYRVQETCNEVITVGGPVEGSTDKAQKRDAVQKLFARNAWMVRALPSCMEGLLFACTKDFPTGKYGVKELLENREYVKGLTGGTANTIKEVVERVAKESLETQMFALNPLD